MLSVPRSFAFPAVLLLGLFSLSRPCQMLAQGARTAAVRSWQGRPTLFVDNQPTLPFFYALSHLSGGRWSWEELPAHNLRLMCETGLRLYQCDLWLEDMWKPREKRLDLDIAQRQVGGILAACPDAAVVVRLHVNAPPWWTAAHPEENTLYMNGPPEERSDDLPFNRMDQDLFRSPRTSLASERWQREAGERVAEFCRRFARTREGRAVIGLHLAGGVYGEWHPWGFIKNEPDGSAPMQAAFRRWLRARYGDDQSLQKAWGSDRYTLASATVPDTAERRCCAGGLWRDPARERRLLDFYKSQQQVATDAAEFFCRTAKENWPRPLITGIFYGYFHFGLCRQAINGHLEVQELFDSPWIDYFAGPTSYAKASRNAGGSGLQRGLVESVNRHGKLWFDEIDNGDQQEKRELDIVHSAPLGDTNYLPIFQRSLWLPLGQRNGLWLFDFGPRRNTGWWDGDLYREEIRRTLDYFEKQYDQAETPAVRPADALVVWDTESFYLAENRFVRNCEQGQDAAAEDLQRCGVGADHIFLMDLASTDLRPYRAVIFMNAWQLDSAQRRFIRDRVAQAGRTVVWNYLAGYSDGQRLDPGLVSTLTGFELKPVVIAGRPRWRMGDFSFENPENVGPLLTVNDPAAEGLAWLGSGDTTVMARKKLAAHTSVYAAVPLHGVPVFRRLLQDAGCHVYQERGDVVLPLGDRLLVHTAQGAGFTVRLKSGETKKIDLKKLATALLDAATGAVILK